MQSIYLTGKGHKTTKQLEINDNGTLCKGPAEIAAIFNNNFINYVRLTIHSPQTGHIYSSPIDTTQPVFSLTETSESKVNSIISSFKNSKSKDMFALDSLFLKKHATTLTGTITKIINISFREGKFPKDWKSAIVVPVHKSGDTTDVNNYRPISVLPVMSKISEKCVAEQLTGHLNSLVVLSHYTPCNSASKPIIPLRLQIVSLWKTSNQKWTKETLLEQSS